MLKNMASYDRIGRIVFSMIVLALFVMGKISGVWALILGALGLIFVVTSAIGFCPLYRIFGISTCKVKE
jgi:hypothetical protein